MPVPPIVAEAAARFLALIDAEAPGTVEGLYVEGSVALDDFHPDSSDIDFVVVGTELPDTAVLERVHARLRAQSPRPFVDGIYLNWDDLAAGPAAVGDRPMSLQGRLTAGRHSPVTWHTLADHGIALRGPAISALDIWTDPAALAAWQNTNLDEYWGRGLDRAAPLFSRAGLGLLTDFGTVWTVTGVARLHYTLTNGGITSKAGAARHARNTFPERWHRLIDEALRIRLGTDRRSLYRTRLARRRDILAYGRMVIEDAHRRYEP
ncbi:aminoglycoside adenylyltransferase domain-containing protein [Nocardia sp. NPDC050712]|uniref:nucleotidyltransferase domain-containing protein n=1 Tax=Nocardia sp. NPDC050712 TaxID=3155518 RepID=UPI0034052929